MNNKAGYFFTVCQTVFLWLFFTVSGTGQVLRMDLQSIEYQSDLIIQARTISIRSGWIKNSYGRNIITKATLQVNKVIKGSLPGEILTLEIPGGTVGDTTQFVTSGIGFSEDEETIIFLQQKPLAVVGEFQGKFTVAEGKVQIGSQMVDMNQFIRVLEKASTDSRAIPEFLSQCHSAEQEQNQKEQEIRLKSGNSANNPVITSISPDKGSAGTRTKVTITGSNFGNTRGTGKVEFFYQTGRPKISAPVLSWTDNEIICQIPVNDSNGLRESAGSGPVTVTNSGGLKSNPVNFKITFGYGLIKWPVNLVLFRINDNLGNVEDEALSIQNAASTWNSANSGFILQYDGNHSNTEISQNNTNEILWGTFPSAATIGRASIWSVGETILECDIKFNEAFKWSSSQSVPMDYMDIETVALHEMGHWLYLRDIYGDLQDQEYDRAKVMFGLGDFGQKKRSLHADDLEGINWIYGRPATYSISGYVKTLAEVPLENVAMTGLPGSPLTNSNGFYSADVENDWSGTIKPEKTGYNFTPLTRNYYNQSADLENQDFTGIPHSSDASLSDLKINNSTISGFSSTVLSYAVELPYGTTAIPILTATASHSAATRVITPATSLPGTASVLVTAENGITTSTYTVGFTVAKNNDATLADLTIENVTVSGFLKTTLEYSIILPYGTTSIPEVSASATDSRAVLLITPAASLPGTTTVSVTAENGIATLTYAVVFSLADPSDDASLSDLRVDGGTIDGFTPPVADYFMELPYRTRQVPEVTATTSDGNASLYITAADSLPGTSLVTVTAEDGSTTKIYTVSFTIAKNTDATLSDLMVNGNTITGFQPDIHAYQVELPYGTEKVPAVTAISNDGNASMTIIPPETLPGTTHIYITAEDGITVLEYLVNFTLTPPSGDARLSDLRTDGSSIPGFRPDILNYSVTLPYGTATCPTITATASQKDATVRITPAAAIPGTAAILVTAQDGLTTNTYQISFTVAKNTDASLADLRVDGVTIAGFNPSELLYTVVLPPETTAIPGISATPADPQAVGIITLAASLPGVATVKVTAEDGLTVKTYEITMRYPLSGIQEINEHEDIRVFPNPNGGTFRIEYKTSGSKDVLLSVFDIQGRIVHNQRIIQANPVFNSSVRLVNPSSGSYYIRIIDGSKISYRKILVDQHE